MCVLACVRAHTHTCCILFCDTCGDVNVERDAGVEFISFFDTCFISFFDTCFILFCDTCCILFCDTCGDMTSEHDAAGSNEMEDNTEHLLKMATC